MPTSLIRIEWRPREPPLAPVAAAAVGDVARKLAQKLLGSTAGIAGLAGVAGRDALVVLGDAAVLPWVDGLVYLGRDPRAPSLLLPVTLECSVPPLLFERAVLAKATGARPPIAVLADPPLLLSVASAEPLSAERIAAWQAGQP